MGLLHTPSKKSTCHARTRQRLSGRDAWGISLRSKDCISVEESFVKISAAIALEHVHCSDQLGVGPPMLEVMNAFARGVGAALYCTMAAGRNLRCRYQMKEKEARCFLEMGGRPGPGHQRHRRTVHPGSLPSTSLAAQWQRERTSAATSAAAAGLACQGRMVH